MVTGPEGRRRAVTRAASASVGNGSASFFGPHVAVGNLRVSQTECPPGYATRITNIAKSPLCPSGTRLQISEHLLPHRGHHQPDAAPVLQQLAWEERHPATPFLLRR